MSLPSQSNLALPSHSDVNGSRLVHFRSALTEVIAEWESLEVTVRRILEELADGIPGSSPTLFRFVDGAFSGFSAALAPDGLVAALDGLRVPEQGACGTGDAPFWSWQPRTVDIRTDEAWTLLRPLLNRHGLDGCWSWPVFSPSGEVLGALVIFRSEARPPEQEERDLIVCAERILALLVEKRVLIADLRYQAEHDALTGALNSVAFQKTLELEIGEAQRVGRKVSVVCLNVDRLRSVNDLLGRMIGDHLLRELATRMRDALDPGAALARTDGDEFVALLREPGPREDVLVTAARLASALRTPFLVGESEIQLRASIGLATFPEHAGDARALLQAAQAAVQRIKNSGGNRVEVCDPRVDYADVNRARLESALHRAIDRGELLLYYQPKICMATGKLDSAEALMRWKSAELGLISPSMFIPLAEETGEIVHMGLWAIVEACRQVSLWHRQPGLPQRIAVNVSPVQLAHPESLTHLRAAIVAQSLDPSKIELEITESNFTEDFSRIRENLQGLRELGVMIALDDFGTGYSSLSILRELPFDTLKIDKSFLEAAAGPAGLAQTKSRRMLARMIDLGHDLGKSVVVEGVETQAQADLLQELNCDVAQGYFFGRPIPPSEWQPRVGGTTACLANLGTAIEAAGPLQLAPSEKV